jgi:hypothetical protein
MLSPVSSYSSSANSTPTPLPNRPCLLAQPPENTTPLITAEAVLTKTTMLMMNAIRVWDAVVMAHEADPQFSHLNFSTTCWCARCGIQHYMNVVQGITLYLPQRKCWLLPFQGRCYCLEVCMMCLLYCCSVSLPASPSGFIPRIRRPSSGKLSSIWSNSTFTSGTCLAVASACT